MSSDASYAPLTLIPPPDVVTEVTALSNVDCDLLNAHSG